MKNIFILVLIPFLFSCSNKEEAVSIDPALLGAFGTLPTQIESADNPLTPEKVSLGKKLYFDKRLSKNQDISCASCHNLETFGVDNQPTSTGHKGQKGGRNSPTVYNAAGHIAQFWDGRAPTVEEQAKGPILNPVEMAMPNAEKVVTVLKSIPQYKEAFAKAFPQDAEPVTYDNLGKAVGAFERTLLTPSRFDSFLQGDQKSLTNREKAGLKKFVETGCTTCHMGPFVGGLLFQKLGMIVPWPDQSDLGRFAVTKNEADKMMFKVPSLRNVEKTTPYFHKGQVATLEEAVKLMGKHQLGKELSEEDISLIVGFLKSLTGELPKEKISEPFLPPSTADTPAPDPS